MAVMYVRRCCCCGVEWGTVAVAIWTMIGSIMSVMQFGYTLAYTDPQSMPNETVTALYGCLIILHAFLIISALLLVIGMVRMNVMLLCPYVVLEAFAFLAYSGLEVALIVALVNGNWRNFPLFSSSTGPINADSFKVIYITMAAIIPLWLFIKIPCVLCVVSLYRNIKTHTGKEFPFVRRGSAVDDVGMGQ